MIGGVLAAISFLGALVLLISGKQDQWITLALASAFIAIVVAQLIRPDIRMPRGPKGEKRSTGVPAWGLATAPPTRSICQQERSVHAPELRPWQWRSGRHEAGYPNRSPSLRHTKQTASSPPRVVQYSRHDISPFKIGERWQFFGIILMSVALGGALLTAFDKWLRGDSFVWWLLLAVMFVFAISTNCMALLKRIP